MKLDFDVECYAGGRYADGQDICLFNLDPIVVLTELKITTSCGKNIETQTNAHVICSFYKLITSSKDFEGSSIGFHLDKHQQRKGFRDHGYDVHRENYFLGFFRKMYLDLHNVKKMLLLDYAKKF